MGLNEFGRIRAASGARRRWRRAGRRRTLAGTVLPWGVIFVALGLGLSFALVREPPITSSRAIYPATPSTRAAVLCNGVWRTTWSDCHLLMISQVGLVNNLEWNGDGAGLFPLFFSAANMEPGLHRCYLAAIHPGTRRSGRAPVTGLPFALSDGSG